MNLDPRPVVRGVDALLDLLRESALYLADEPVDEQMLDDGSYGWRVTTFESNTRIDATLRTLHATPEQAFLEATDLRLKILACGFYEFARCEVYALRMEAGDDNEPVGWRGRVELGLRSVGDPRGSTDRSR